MAVSARAWGTGLAIGRGVFARSAIGASPAGFRLRSSRPRTEA